MSESEHKLFVEFFSDTAEDVKASRAEGVPKFKDVEKIRIRWPGDKSRELVAPADGKSLRGPDGRWLTYAERWPEHYKAFKAGQAYIGEGTPISEAPFLTEARRRELRAMEIHTIETLAELPDRMRTRLGMGGLELMQQARAWVEKQKGFAAESRLASENEALRAQLNALAEKVAMLGQSSAPKVDAVSPFASWADDDMKAYIKDATGQAPRGQPSHDTLVKMCDEINTKAKEKADA